MMLHPFPCKLLSCVLFHFKLCAYVGSICTSKGMHAHVCPCIGRPGDVLQESLNFISETGYLLGLKLSD